LYDLDFTSRSNFLAAFLHDHAHIAWDFDSPSKKKCGPLEGRLCFGAKSGTARDLVDEALPFGFVGIGSTPSVAWEKNSDSSSPGFDGV
jgi:hypothetical protein